jgi:hypothetical protein
MITGGLMSSTAAGGLGGAGLGGEGGKTEGKGPEELILEALKAVRESAFGRWEKRRDYEWKLSFGLWTAIAAFIAITFGKDFNIQYDESVKWACAIFGLLLLGAHVYYLIGIIENTIGDVKRQYWAEESIEKYLKDLKTNFSDLEKPSVYRRYGYTQAAITLILVIAANFAVWAPRVPQAKATHQVTLTVEAK